MLAHTALYHLLLDHFGHQGWWPLMTCIEEEGADEQGYHPNDYSFPKNEQQSFEISVGAILAQNTSWKNVERAMTALKEENLLTKQSLRAVSQEKLASLITSAGYFNQKAKKLKILASFDGEMTRENLLALWGIGKETADSILCYAHRQPLFVVDAYTQRIFHRFGFKERGYDALQQSVMKELQTTEELNEYHALLVALGKHFCKPVPLCASCPLEGACRRRDVR